VRLTLSCSAGTNANHAPVATVVESPLNAINMGVPRFCQSAAPPGSLRKCIGFARSHGLKNVRPIGRRTFCVRTRAHTLGARMKSLSVNLNTNWNRTCSKDVSESGYPHSKYALRIQRKHGHCGAYPCGCPRTTSRRIRITHSNVSRETCETPPPPRSTMLAITTMRDIAS